VAALLISGLCGCELPAVSSFSFEDSTTSESAATTGSPDFDSALAVLRAECSSCHTYTHGFESYDTETEFINNYYVNPGSPEDSSIYTRIRDTEFDGLRNMPPSGSLEESERTAIRAWIEGIGAADAEVGGGSTKASRLSAALAVLWKAARAAIT